MEKIRIKSQLGTNELILDSDGSVNLLSINSGSKTPLTLNPAGIIVLDNLSRNMFRGSSKAFATDEWAYEVAKTIIDSPKMFSQYKFNER